MSIGKLPGTGVGTNSLVKLNPPSAPARAQSLSNKSASSQNWSGWMVNPLHDVNMGISSVNGEPQLVLPLRRLNVGTEIGIGGSINDGVITVGHKNRVCEIKCRGVGDFGRWLLLTSMNEGVRLNGNPLPPGIDGLWLPEEGNIEFQGQKIGYRIDQNRDSVKAQEPDLNKTWPCLLGPEDQILPLDFQFDTDPNGNLKPGNSLITGRVNPKILAACRYPIILFDTLDIIAIQTDIEGNFFALKEEVTGARSNVKEGDSRLEQGDNFEIEKERKYHFTTFEIGGGLVKVQKIDDDGRGFTYTVTRFNPVFTSTPAASGRHLKSLLNGGPHTARAGQSHPLFRFVADQPEQAQSDEIRFPKIITGNIPTFRFERAPFGMTDELRNERLFLVKTTAFSTSSHRPSIVCPDAELPAVFVDNQTEDSPFVVFTVLYDSDSQEYNIFITPTHSSITVKIENLDYTNPLREVEYSPKSKGLDLVDGDIVEVCGFRFKIDISEESFFDQPAQVEEDNKPTTVPGTPAAKIRENTPNATGSLREENGSGETPTRKDLPNLEETGQEDSTPTAPSLPAFMTATAPEQIEIKLSDQGSFLVTGDTSRKGESNLLVLEDFSPESILSIFRKGDGNLGVFGWTTSLQLLLGPDSIPVINENMTDADVLSLSHGDVISIGGSLCYEVSYNGGLFLNKIEPEDPGEATLPNATPPIEDPYKTKPRMPAIPPPQTQIGEQYSVVPAPKAETAAYTIPNMQAVGVGRTSSLQRCVATMQIKVNGKLQKDQRIGEGDREIIIGKNPGGDANITFNNAEIPDQAAKLIVDQDGKLFVTDMGSGSAVLLRSGQYYEVSTPQIPISVGDCLLLGDHSEVEITFKKKDE
ncbi:MAG: hypothetical protein ABIE74_04670 [Pseudomonadota bacterium]